MQVGKVSAKTGFGFNELKKLLKIGKEWSPDFNLLFIRYLEVYELEISSGKLQKGLAVEDRIFDWLVKCNLIKGYELDGEFNLPHFILHFGELPF